MQYLMAVAWVVFIVHELRRAHDQHCAVKRRHQFRDRLARIKPGMSPRQVRDALGGPARVTAEPNSLTWQYRINRELKNVIFAGGKVVECDRPSQQTAGE